jgi:hypothetical protein
VQVASNSSASFLASLTAATTGKVASAAAGNLAAASNQLVTTAGENLAAAGDKIAAMVEHTSLSDADDSAGAAAADAQKLSTSRPSMLQQDVKVGSMAAPMTGAMAPMTGSMIPVKGAVIMGRGEAGSAAADGRSGRMGADAPAGAAAVQQQQVQQQHVHAITLQPLHLQG